MPCCHHSARPFMTATLPSGRRPWAASPRSAGRQGRSLSSTSMPRRSTRQSESSSSSGSWGTPPRRLHRRPGLPRQQRPAQRPAPLLPPAVPRHRAGPRPRPLVRPATASGPSRRQRRRPCARAPSVGQGPPRDPAPQQQQQPRMMTMLFRRQAHMSLAASSGGGGRGGTRLLPLSLFLKPL